MDFVPLIDAIGEAATAVLGGAVVGALFGFAAQRSAFCTRAAVLDVTRRRDLRSLATWTTGFAVAVLGVQCLLSYGLIDARETRFFSTAQSLSGALVGGLAFGIGMVLSRGCVSRMLVLSASGNLRAVYTALVVALAGYATYAGVLVPFRDAIGGLWSTAAIGGNDLLAQFGLAQETGLAIGGVLVLLAVIGIAKTRISLWRVLGGAGVGLSIVLGWYFTYTLSLQLFDPIQAESLSFIRPLATTGALATGRESIPGLDQGVLIGALAAAFLASVLFGGFRIQTFSEPGTPSIVRYTAGGVLMGFGGILAVGCTIGAGFTGGSVLAISSLLGLAAMIAGGAIADRFVDRDLATDADRARTRPAVGASALR
ncbi:YeeE/YedE family protein [Fulvimarina sp. 2208YS6-2-32]|uniref:YeeE/YedE family protein n=1 Tax=Fulvimarina uroteuthidis TaxID=3098149 RepID=A0ABU5I1C4_9HYPH|nr:YeeE/YedE family protein [Fulvimarina sp. 2208YS6-2-32]MDY8107976.1 YeeE/YedE family protein [Fulvimarina sp. 2208YS6-2-32]